MSKRALGGESTVNCCESWRTFCRGLGALFGQRGSMELDLILASGSPRRRDLLSSAGVRFDVIVPEIDERRRPGEGLRTYVLRNAFEKAEEVWSRLIPELVPVLAADTVVVLDGELLEKPTTVIEAMDMLEVLSGRTHEVWTSVCFTRRMDEMFMHKVVVTEVEFAPLSDEVIERYVASGEPMDKAGAYGIQGGAAGFVRAIRGSYTNVVGLPLAEVLEALRQV